MPFIAQRNPQINEWQAAADALPEPQGGGHILDALAKLLFGTDVVRTWGRAVEGKYKDQPWTTVVGDMTPRNPDPTDQLAGLGTSALGMVNLPKKSYENVLLHRTIGNPKELDYIRRIYQGRSAPSEVPTSFVSPSYTSVFHGNEPNIGLLFDVKKPEHLSYIGAKDLQSDKILKDLPEGLEHKLRFLDRKLERMDPIDPKWDNYTKAWDKTVEKFAGNRWIPNLETIPGSKDDVLEYLINKQQDFAKNSRDIPEKLLHNEAIYKIKDPTELVGVRVPRVSGTDPQLLDALDELVAHMGLPVYDMPQPHSREKQIEQLGQFFQGAWTPNDQYGYRIMLPYPLSYIGTY